MSRGDWGFLENLLEESQEYSTAVGRVWLTVLFLFRILVLGTAAESAWDDEQSDFVCNTKQPGCEAVCYDKAFPVSHFRYFILQVIFVSTPTILYFGYVALKGHEEPEEETKEQRGRQKDRKAKEIKLAVIQEENEDGKQVQKEKKLPNPPKLKGKLLGAYTVSIILKVLIEIGFIVGLWFLYGFVIPAKYECQRTPCPHTVDCFVSRPTEKTIFTIYIQVIALVSVLLNVVELFYLLQLSITHYMEKKYQYQQLGIPRAIEKTPVKLQPTELQALSYQENGHLYLPAENGTHAQSVMDWTESKPHPTEDMLLTYLHCIGDTTHRGHYKEDVHTKPNKSDPKEKHCNDKHYV
ncbi:gap junction protein alpha 4 isoform X1 [Pangasianodon hypophthalmus]|uniref:gap junction protein alpha 4 isoform X1 n=1 Tax=Pangasianodon hypophthalmus TaxID=310915 RepID=UPI000EFF224F|nr:gap junction protein alpha 4 isoform X1 [Pangasianodon hypophthalmus]